MESRYEYREQLHDHLYGGFMLKKEETAVIKMLGLRGENKRISEG